ncbi:hypothetical protein, partial [Desulfonatronospira sp. MSAO_Bac3]|uniref:hypothetical protein n=1 Tax=Desulfonatronospira sp. MSAO_Bac3 TaxID=2293857 RepID=UPI002580C040
IKLPPPKQVQATVQLPSLAKEGSRSRHGSTLSHASVKYSVWIEVKLPTPKQVQATVQLPSLAKEGPGVVV